ncbi:PIN domain-containing protein [Moraxella sp. ZY210820]|uniref:PIN domain-containing protein n=1 Tax=unclassified Moraxella TaxID=2685852 RepID=UPI00272F6294|nr:PIN domain-containing protein [Moraxella sp. ZY210820]WLF84597.1 PIN domain-containing protein [Moraxella sp. ZY210820]
MSDKAFIDTNILVYTVDGRFPEKRQMALDLIANLHANQNLVISTQVLQEFFNVTTYKLKLDPVEMQNTVANLSKLPTVLTDISLIEQGIKVSIHHKLRLWDALMIVAGYRADCKIMYSEDLTHGQIIQGIRILNPFKL